MSRSRRHTPIIAITTAESDKFFKQISHRQARAAERSALAQGNEPPHPRMFGDEWKSQKDGKQWLGSRHPKLMRK